MDRQLCRRGLGGGGAPHVRWTSGPPSSGKSAPSLTPPPPVDLPRSARTAPAPTDRDGARRCCRLTVERPMRSARKRAAGWICGGCRRASGLGAGGEVVACLAASPASTDRPSGALMKRRSWHTWPPLRHTTPLAARREECVQAPSGLDIPAKPPPPLAQGAPCIHGPSQQREISSRAPGRSLYTPNSGTKSTTKHSRSVSLGPVQRGARTCEPCEGGGHRPG